MRPLAINRWVLIFISLVIIGIRIVITPRLNLPTYEGSYEAFAHMFVGGLFGCAIKTWIARKDIDYYDYDYGAEDAKFYWYLAWAVSLFELFMFTIQKVGSK